LVGLLQQLELQVLISAMVVCFDGVVDVIDEQERVRDERTQPVRFNLVQLNYKEYCNHDC
jgi:hypothetical protein